MNLMLTPLSRWSDFTLLGLRLITGAFLVYGVWDNITSSEHMQEFVAFLDRFGFPVPHMMAPLSVWVQFACGLSLILGLLTRWAGLLLAVNFVVAVIMVHWNEDLRGWWPAIILVFLGFHFAAAGSGRYGIDGWLGDRRSRR